MDLAPFALGLGLILLLVALLALKRGWIAAGGRRTRQRIAGRDMRLIAVPQAIVGAAATLVGLAGLLGMTTLGQFSDEMVGLIAATYLITNLGIGGYLAMRQGGRPHSDT